MSNLFVLGFLFRRIRKLPKGKTLKEEAKERSLTPMEENKTGQEK